MRTTLLFIGDEHGLRTPDARRVRHSSAMDPEFGKSLRARRIALGMTQRELAEHMNGSEITICRIETGVYPITAKMRQRIENALNALAQ